MDTTAFASIGLTRGNWEKQMKEQPNPTRYLVGPTTERLMHRTFTVADADVAYALNSDPEVLRYTGDVPLTSVSHARQFIAGYTDFDTVGYGRWACVLRQTQVVIGFCGLKYLPDMGVVDVGFRLLPRYWGMGLATEACTACVAFGFETIGLKQIVAYVMPENTASVRVLEKSGLRFETECTYDGIPVCRFVADASEP